MSTSGHRFAFPTPSLASSITHPKLQSRPLALALLDGGSTRRPSGSGNALRLLCPALPASAVPPVRRSRRSLGKHRNGVVCYAAPFSPQTLQWVSAVSAVVLMFARGTAIQKPFLVPFFVMQAPASVISWIKGEYGAWTAFLALLVRLFYFIPGGLELPFLGMLLVIVAPSQTMSLRGSQAGAIVSLAITGYLAFQHFSRVGSLRKAYDQGSIIATLAIICIVVVPCLMLL